MGLVSGLVMMPLGALLWPLSHWMSARLLLGGLGPDSMLADVLGMLWVLLTLLGWLWLSMGVAQWLLALWDMRSMEAVPVMLGHRTLSAAGMVFFVGLMLGLGIALRLRRVGPIERVAKRWKAWTQRWLAP